MTKKENSKEPWATSDKLWDATRKTFQTATFKAGQYRRIVQKKIDLTSIHKKIGTLHSDLGKLIDERREAGVTDLLAGEEVQDLFLQLDSLKQAAAALEEEIEAIKEEEQPPEKEGEEEEEPVEEPTPKPAPKPKAAKPKTPKPKTPKVKKTE